MPQALQTVSTDLKQFGLLMLAAHSLCCTLSIYNVDMILLKRARFLPLS